MPLPPTVDLAQRDTVRLISTGRLKDPVLLPLAANHGALEDLAALESVTNGRLIAQETGLPQLDPRELVFGRAGYTFINAAFTHTRPGGNRFNDDNRGAWYCAFDPDTALGEVAYHLTRELEAVGRFENITDYAELIADFSGPFHDLRAFDVGVEPALHKDPAIAYPSGQSLARQLRVDSSSNGIIYPSIRHAGGTCLVSFRPDLVQNLRQGGIWRLEWQGTPTPTVTRQGQ
jgi:RES domain-containing protein